MHGDLDRLGTFNSVAIVLQLILSSVVIQLFDELLQKGHGVGNSISLFIGANITGTFFRACFSFTTLKTEHDSEYEGAIINFFHSLVSKSNKVYVLQHAFFRANAPNITSILSTAIVFAGVIWVMVSFFYKAKFCDEYVSIRRNIASESVVRPTNFLRCLIFLIKFVS